MRKILVLILCLVSANGLLAQHTVSGIVSDKKDSSKLIEGVEVFIPEFSKTDLSKEGGTFIIRNIGIGTVHIQFTRKGYFSQVKTISTVDSATVINVELEPYGISDNEISASGNQSKLPQNLPFPVENYQASQLRREGNHSLLKSLSYKPGIDNVSFGHICNPTIRGLSFNHILMYQSGTQILDNSIYGLNNYELIDEGTGTVEILKGPAALMYGENAMGGVLIFSDEKMPLAGNITGDLNLGFFTNTLGINTNLGMRGSSKNGAFYSVRFGAKNHTSYIQGEGDKVRKNTEAKDFAYNSGYASENVKGMFGWSKKWGQSKVTFAYRKIENEIITSYTDSAIAVMEEITERERSINTPSTEQTTFLVSNENIFLVGKSQMMINLSWQSNDREQFHINDMLRIDAKYISNASSKAGFTGGVQGFYKSNEFINSEKFSGIGIYSLFRYDTEKINFLAGARFDMHNSGEVFSDYLNYNLMSGSAGVAWHPVKDLTIKLNAASGFSKPGEYESLFYYPNYGVVDGNSLLEEERNYEGDFGLSWNNSNISLGANLFYNMINNYIYVDSSFSSLSSPFQFNQADANLNGGEFSLSLHPESVRWLVLESSYSNVRGEFKDSKNNLPNSPADKIIASVIFRSERMNYLYRPYIKFTLSEFLKHDRIFGLETPTDSYSLFDFHLGGSFKWGQQFFDISLSVNNVLNTGYFSHLSQLKYLEPVPVREIGRNVTIEFHVPFGIKNNKAG